MKAETQANALTSLVEKKKQYPEYELALPLFEVKSNLLKKLQKNDLFLVGLESLKLYMFSNAGSYAEVEMFMDSFNRKIKINYVGLDSFHETKKHALVKCSFGSVQSEKFEVGYKVSIGQINLEKVKLFVKDKNIAEGRLVKVDDEIAIQITKVNKNDK